MTNDTTTAESKVEGRGSLVLDSCLIFELHFRFQKTCTIPVFFEDLSRIQSFLEPEVKLNLICSNQTSLRETSSFVPRDWLINTISYAKKEASR